MNCVDQLGLSPLQEEAVLDRRTPLLVAAGAGSGKTSLLVAYFVHALLDEGVPLDRLIAVTFTRKAASELAGRIRETLEALGQIELARSLDAASIGTIHSLCRRLVRERSLDAGVDPASAVLEAESASLVKDQISRLAWERVVERASEEELGVLASGGDRLRREMVALYDRLRGLGWENPRLEMGRCGTSEEARLALARTVEDALVAGRAVDKIGLTLAGDLERLADCRLWLDGCETNQHGSADLGRSASFFPSRKTRSMEPFFEPVRIALTFYRNALAQSRLMSLVSVMNELLVEFHAAYHAHKQERGLLDFSDLELRARDLVQTKGGTSAMTSGGWVLIDEFQDTNELQCSILESLGASRLLMVGDEVQSIYHFRGADVEVFRKRRTLLERSGGPGGVRLLDINYRSRREILTFVNRLFGHDTFLGPGFTPLRSPEPDESSEQAVAGLRMPPGPVEVVVVSRADTPDRSDAAIQRAEALAVAVRVRDLVSGQGLAMRDVVVLLPAQTYVSVYQQALLSQGLSVYIVRGQGYYSQEEVTDVVAFLRLLLNPQDDLALVAVLRSPIVGVSDDALYLLGADSRRKRGSLWRSVAQADSGALPEDDYGRLADFLAWFRQLQRRVGRPGLARLIDDIVSGCDYDLCVLGSAEGKRRFANIRKLMRFADEYEALEGPDLAGFVSLLQSLGDVSDREGSAPTLAEGEDVVRVMTVHQAKGLEFPAIVLAGLGSDVPRGPRGDFVVADDRRVAVFLRDSRRPTHESLDLCWGPGAEIVEEERVKERQEDVRLLYVAMTRAKERLVLVGARPNDGDLSGSRIGRIVSALGLSAFPPEGEEVALDEAEAVVVAVAAGSGVEDTWMTAAPASCPAHAGAETAPPPRLLGPVPRETVRLQVSFSALAAYRRCPRRYYLERVLRLDPAEDLVAGALEEEASLKKDDSLLDEQERFAGRDVGLLVHALLENLAAEAPSEEADLARSAEDWLTRTGTRLSSPGLARAVELTMAFWQSPAAAAGPQAEREVPFAFAHQGVVVTGVMDLVDRGKDVWHIVDYKTNALGGRPPSDIAAEYDLQACIYCLAALRAGAPAVRMDFVFLERPDLPVTREYGLENIPSLDAVIGEALSGLRSSLFPSREGSHCGGCPVDDVCGVMAPA